jgi:hypothetical protein
MRRAVLICAVLALPSPRYADAAERVKRWSATNLMSSLPPPILLRRSATATQCCDYSRMVEWLSNTVIATQATQQAYASNCLTMSNSPPTTRSLVRRLLL